MQLIDGQIKISVIGVGYVGLPLSILLSTKYDVICFDKDKSKLIYDLCLDQEKLEKTKVHEFMELFVK